MTSAILSRKPGFFPVLPIVVGMLAAGIFVVDTFLAVHDAVAVLYVMVVTLSVGFLERRGLFLISLACGTAAIVSFLFQFGVAYEENAFVRLVIALVAIGFSLVLALTNLSAAKGLRNQARLLDLSSDAILTRDMDGVITYWNRGAETLYGWGRNEAVGKIAPQLLRTTANVPLEEAAAQMVRSGHWEGELVCHGRDGKPLIMMSRWSLTRDERGHPTSVMETNTDITDRRQAEQNLTELQAQLAHVTRVTTLAELTASIAHEVNQPLASVVTNAEVCLRLLDRQPPPAGEVREAVKDIIGAGRRAGDIVKRLRALFKKSETRKAPVDINEIVRETIPLVRRELLNKDVSLRLELAPSLPGVLGETVQLQQVLINLLLNAAQAMDSVVDRRRDLVIRSRLGEAGGIVVAVEDTGVGIDPRDSHIFEAFHTTKPDGMGMGLAISRSIVENHGGRLSVTANPGPGATFQFTLPPLPRTAS